MKPFKHLKPGSVNEAIAMKTAGGASARYFAGGTNLFDLMKLDVESPTQLIDLTGLDELARIKTSGAGAMSFGALCKMGDVAEDATLKRSYPLLSESLWKAASQQIRNMASVGGNLLQRTRCPYFRGGEQFPCNKRTPGSGCSAIGGLDRSHAVLGTTQDCIATYPGDWAVALVALDAQVEVVGATGRRSIPVRTLHRVPDKPSQETVLSDDELMVEIRVPTSFPGRASTYHKVRDRQSYAFALASAAVSLQMEGSRVVDSRIALGGIATTPFRATAAEEELRGKVFNDTNVRQAARAALSSAAPGTHNAFKVPLGVETLVDALTIARRRAQA